MKWKVFCTTKCLINLLKCKAIKINVCPLACVGKLVGKVLKYLFIVFTFN